MPRFPVAGITKLSELSIDAALDMDGHGIALDAAQTVDGLDCSGVEAGATADQTGGEIKSLYEAQANTNVYTDAEKTKLAGMYGLQSDTLIASDTLKHSNDTARSTSTGGAVKLKQINVSAASGMVRLYFECRTSNVGYTNTVRLYRNGVLMAPSYTFSTNSTTYVPVKWDIFTVTGDTIELYVDGTVGIGRYIQNMRIYADNVGAGASFTNADP